ncbi:MAG: TonB-dependent receptor, partial [Saprospiraceae bacterium]
DPIFVNLYGDYHGRLEANVHLNKSWNKYFHNGLYLHNSRHSGQRDHNNDGFYDDAESNLLNGLWRNLFYGKKWEGQINFQALHNTRKGGQKEIQDGYIVDQTINHLNLSGNLGYVGFQNLNQNTGSIYDISYSEFYGRIGNNLINNKEQHALIQLIYSHNFKDDVHNLTIGPSFNYNKAEEDLFRPNRDPRAYYYNEITPGIFVDYDYKFGESSCEDKKKFIISTSQRIEYLKLNKWFWTPRISLRYNINEEWTTRFSVGRGYRFIRLLSDNINVFTTNREFSAYPIPDYESSWNYGVNLVGKPHIFDREGEFNIDLYATQFEKQLVVDLDSDEPSKPTASLYSLVGNSRALSASSSLAAEIAPKLNAKIGIRFQDNKLQLKSGFREQIMIPRWRGLLSLDYTLLNKKLTWNITSHFVGRMRLPDKTYFPYNLINEHDKYSKSYLTLQSQLNYSLKNWELYAGCENITNYTQHQAIISPVDPTSVYFSANEVYAPINGIKPYLGFKYRMIRK